MIQVFDGTKRTNRLPLRLAVIASLVTVIGFSAVCIGVLLDMRQSQEELARRTSENLATTIDADVSSNLELYDLSIRSAASNVLMPDVQSASKALRQLILFDHAATARHFSPLQVFDAAGRLIIDASTFDPQDVRCDDEEFFLTHRNNADAGLYISKPMLHNGAYAVVLSRRIVAPDGRFAGIVTGAIRFSYFHDLFGRLHLDRDDTINIFRRDGTVIMRRPFDLDFIGRNIAHSPLLQHVFENQSGSITAYGALDGRQRLYTWVDNSKPLFVMIGRPWESIYALWWRQAIRIASVMGLLSLFAIVATVFLAREMTRRSRAEGLLEEMALTDPLTGLRNRRKFDAVLAFEWRRAERAGTPVALLMIDADHFKAYNDRFGHQAGDQALLAISKCIATSARRVGDCAARHGGEEFALLLPGLDAEDALLVAENIRRDIARQPVGIVTITASIGVASLTPGADNSTDMLMELADKALYAAKAGGRNQSCLFATPPKMALVA